MASEEERAKILAEYMAAADKDDGDDEEAEFQDFDDEDDANSFDDSDSDDDGGNHASNGKHKDENYAVLDGSLSLNDEGRLVFSGLWCMKKDLKPTSALPDDASKEKKKTKFKLKSKQSFTGKKFSLANPLLADNKPRTMIFDGFFTTDKTDTVQPHRKIKEKDVEITFSQGVKMRKASCDLGSEDKNKNSSSTEGDCIVVKGKGTNEFGSFVLEGLYETVSDSKQSQPLTCSKRYKFVGSTNDDYDSEDDYEISGDEAADLSELVGLADDAELSVEELRKKYYGGGGADDSKEEVKSPAAKKAKIIDDDDDDDCGF